MLAALLANINRDTKKRPKPFTADDFMPEFAPDDKEPMSWETMKQFAMAMNAAMGGKTGKRNNGNDR